MDDAADLPSPLMTLPELCALFHITPGSVHKSRVRGGHPLFSKGFCPLGPRAGLRWRTKDVLEYIENQYAEQVSA